MAKAPKKPVEYSRISPLIRAMMDPYTGRRISPDDENGIVMDKNRARFHVDMGDAEYIEEDCPSPFEPAPAPAPVKPPLMEKTHAPEKGKV